MSPPLKSDRFFLQDMQVAAWRFSAFERRGNNLNGFQDFRTDNCSSQGQNLISAVPSVPNSLDSGKKVRRSAAVREYEALELQGYVAPRNYQGLLCAA